MGNNIYIARRSIDEMFDDAIKRILESDRAKEKYLKRVRNSKKRGKKSR